MSWADMEREQWRTSGLTELFPILRKGLLHVTSIEGYRGIRESGHIIPNRGQFPFTYSRSQGSFGIFHGYICLFDFESASEEEIIPMHLTSWGDFFPSHHHGSVTIVLRLNRQLLTDKLIPNSVAPSSSPDPKNYKLRIPLVEVWYPDPIPVSAIDDYIIVAEKPSQDRVFEEFVKEKEAEFHNTIDRIDEWLGRHVGVVAERQEPNLTIEELRKRLQALNKRTQDSDPRAHDQDEPPIEPE